MNYRPLKRFSRLLFSTLFIASLLSADRKAIAAPATETDYTQQAAERKNALIESNQIENWPAGPAIGAEAAILMEADTGVILYAKNINAELYPASTTKLMTCLVAAEHSQLEDMVSFSHDAVFSLESGSSNIGIDAGQSMPMEECLYGILTASANEVANAVAEHVGGSMDAFAEMMNQKAQELGCQNTHFVNAHGLYDENHYTSAYDLALIAKAFFQNELLAKIGNTSSHHFEATATQPDDFIVRNKHQLITGEIPYEGIKGGKTGYTDEARQTLVTCAEQNGMKLICVIMKEESPEQFYDTVKLFDYGFTNFSIVNVSENETRYSIQSSDFFNTSSDIFGNSDPVLSLNQDSYLIVPATTDFDELESEISYDTALEGQIAQIHYYYHGAYLGTASIDLAEPADLYEFSKNTENTAAEGKKVIVVNVKKVLFLLIAVAVILIAGFTLFSIVRSYSFRRTVTRSTGFGKFRKRKGKRRKLRFPSSRSDKLHF